MHKFLLLLLLLFSSFFNTLNAAQSEEKLIAIIIGKVSKFVTWEDNTQTDFVITILKNSFDDLFDKVYDAKKIKSKNIKIRYIDTLDDLAFTHILYIPASESSNIKEILKKLEGKNILTISSIRGFADKKGTLQIYFVSQKIKLKINLNTAKRDHLKIKSSLLRIATVIQGDI